MTPRQLARNARRRKLLNCGLNLSEIARHEGLNVSTLSDWAARHAPEYYVSMLLPESDQAERRGLLASGMSIKAAASALGISPGALSCWAARHFPEAPARHQAKAAVSAAERARVDARRARRVQLHQEAARLCGEGLSSREVARRLGIGSSTVLRAVAGAAP